MQQIVVKPIFNLIFIFHMTWDVIGTILINYAVTVPQSHFLKQNLKETKDIKL